MKLSSHFIRFLLLSTKLSNKMERTVSGLRC